MSTLLQLHYSCLINMTKTVAKSTVLTKNVVAAKSFEQEQDGALNWLVDGVSDARKFRWDTLL